MKSRVVCLKVHIKSSLCNNAQWVGACKKKNIYIYIYIFPGLSIKNMFFAHNGTSLPILTSLTLTLWACEAA